MLMKVIRHLSALALVMFRDPGQVKFLPRWLRTLGHSTLDSRIPWLPYRVLDRLAVALSAPSSTVYEFGGGGSTVWLSDRQAAVTTVEHDRQWYDALRTTVGSLPNVDLRFASAADDFHDYVHSIDGEGDDAFDVVIVDGRARVRCLQAAIPKVRPGGLLILDDTDRERYGPAFSAVTWPHVTYRGLTPSKTSIGVTTVWQRPSSS